MKQAKIVQKLAAAPPTGLYSAVVPLKCHVWQLKKRDLTFYDTLTNYITITLACWHRCARINAGLLHWCSIVTCSCRCSRV